MDKVIKYQTELREYENSLLEKYTSDLAKNGKIRLSSNIISGLTIGGGGATIATALTVVGAPVAIVTGTISAIFGITTIVLDKVSHNGQKSLRKLNAKLNVLQTARMDLESLTSVGYNTNRVLTDEQYKQAYQIYTNALKKIGKIRSTYLNDYDLEADKHKL